MPQIRKVLGACTVEAAKRRRVCHRDRKNHSIEAGILCLVIKEPMLGNTKNYCAQCALAILDQALDDLQSLRDQLSSVRVDGHPDDRPPYSIRQGPGTGLRLRHRDQG